MGIFSSKSVYTVYLSHSSIFTTAPKNFYVSTIVNGVLNDEDTTLTMYKIYNSGPVHALRKYQQYAEDKYYYGLPTISTNVNYLNYSAAEQIITDIEQEPISILNTYYGAVSQEEAVHLEAVKNYGDSYDINTRILTIGGKNYLFAYVTNTNQAVFRAISFYTEETGDGGPTTYTVYSYQYLPVPPERSGTWYIISYILDNTPEETKYFEYQSGSGTYPTLDIAPSIIEDKILPIVPLRENFAFLSDPVILATTKKLLKKMEVPYDDIVDGLASTGGIGDISNAFFNLSIPIDTTDTNSQKYIHEFFKRLHLSSDFLVSKELFVNGQEETGYVNRNSYRISEQKFSSNFTYAYTEFDVVTGSIGKIGSTSISIETAPDYPVDLYTTYEYEDDDDNQRIGFVAHNGPPVNGYIVTKVQTSDTQYEEIKCYGPLIISLLPKTNNKLRGHTTGTNKPEDFRIPLVLDILRKELSIKDQESVIYLSMVLTLYGATKERVKWYQSGFGSLLLKVIIAVVATVVSFYLGPQAGQGIFTTSAFYAQVVANVFIAYGVEFALKAAGDNELIKALITVAAAYFSATGGSTSASGLSTADKFLLAVKAVSTYTLASKENEINLLYEEIRESNNLLESKEEELQRARDFNNVSTLDSNLIVAKRLDKYYRNPGQGFIANSLQTNMATKMKEAPGISINMSKDVWNTLPALIT